MEYSDSHGIQEVLVLDDLGQPDDGVKVIFLNFLSFSIFVFFLFTVNIIGDLNFFGRPLFLFVIFRVKLAQSCEHESKLASRVLFLSFSKYWLKNEDIFINQWVAWVLGSIGVSSLHLWHVHFTKKNTGGSRDSHPFYLTNDQPYNLYYFDY